MPRRANPDVSARMGCKGGISATAGRKATRYRGDFPDGTPFTKTSFHENTAVAWAGVYSHNGIWYAAGMWPVEEAVPSQYRAIKVERVL